MAADARAADGEGVEPEHRRVPPRSRDAMKKLATNPKVTLTKRIPHGTGQTYLREILLVLDHNAYHVAAVIRRLLGA